MNTIAKEMLDKSGAQIQWDKLREETAELGEALKNKTLPDIVEELADVLVVAEILRADPQIRRAGDVVFNYKMRRCEAFLRSGYATWAEWKAADYPGFNDSKKIMLERVKERLQCGI